jgi:DNA-nicking Smr family endonuclease
MKRKQPPPEDIELFRKEVADVRPLKSTPRAPGNHRQPAPWPLQRQRDEAAVLLELLDDPGPDEGLETGENLAFLRPGSQKRYLARLRRGLFAVEDHFDLHGLNETAASQALHAFVDDSVRRGLGCIRVVHGKGLRSRTIPKLKLMTNRLLRRHPAVVAFASCRPADGGTGAVVVLLKSR